MADATPPSSFSLWLEEALTGWILPVAALALAAAAWALYAVGLLPEAPAGAAVAAVVALAAALFTLRQALAPAVGAATRAAALALALGVASVSAWPAWSAVLPGAPLAEGQLARTGAALALPAGLAGPVRLLVHAPLPPGGTPVVEFRMAGGAAPMEGHVERTVSFARAGRGGRAAVTRDHNETWVHGAVAGGASLTLERLSGEVAGPIHVSVHRQVLPPAGLWVAALLLVAAAAVLDRRLGKGSLAAVAGMAAAFGLLVGLNATPETAVGTSLGAVLLGGLGGALAGGLAAALARLLPIAPAVEAPGRAARRARGA
jgi:hypothetical protein